MSNLEILDNEGNRIVRPDVVAFVMQAAQVAQLVRLRKLQELEMGTGAINKPIEVTTSVKEIQFAPKLIALALVNDGPGDVVFTIMRLDAPNSTDGTLKSTEKYDIDCKYPVINRIKIRTTSNTATVRLFGKEGRG